MRIARITGAVAAVASLALAASCTSGSGDGPTPTSQPESSAPTDIETIVEGLDVPWSVAFYGEIPLVSERDSGRILEIGVGGDTREVATIADVAPMGEGGLLGLAVHEGFLYAYFTAEDDNRIERYELTGGAGSVAIGSGETVIDGLPSANFHNGGRLAFGPDGMLYATVGDAGEPDSAQDLDRLSGKILRLTPTGAVPSDNPFPDSPVYSFGHRNPQGIAWADDGAMYAGEFGQNTWDELNVIEAGGNYGWPEVEGAAGQEGFIDPVQQWEPAEASPSGIAISADAVHIANLRGERLREVPLDELTTSVEYLVDEYGRLRDVVVAPDGALWVLTNNTDGRGDPSAGDDRILRIELD